MKKILRNIFLLFLISGLIYSIIMYTGRVKKTSSQTMEQLINDISLDKTKLDITEQIKTHKQYILKLRSLNAQIKNLGAKLENKTQLAKSFGKIGDEYAKEEFLPIALAYYSMGLEVFPQDSVLNYKKGLILSNYAGFYPDKKEDYYKQAQQFYNTAIHISPNYPEPHYGLAALYLVASESKISIGSLEEALKEVNLFLDKTTTKKNTDAYFLKARIAYALGDNNQAIQSYQYIVNTSSIGSEPYNTAKTNLAQLSGSF